MWALIKGNNRPIFTIILASTPVNSDGRTTYSGVSPKLLWSQLLCQCTRNKFIGSAVFLSIFFNFFWISSLIESGFANSEIFGRIILWFFK